MDIAALSTAMHQGQIRGQASVAVAGKVKDMMEQNGANLIRLMESTKVMEASVTPHKGGSVDVSL